MLLGAGFMFWASKNLEPQKTVVYAVPKKTLWNFQSIDTMKYSRDIAREKLHDSSFDATIDMQVKNIAESGATHVAIATPYDEEFVPFLARWVEAARTYGLHVWFRGNWSGWEGWFDYPKISRDEHLQKTEAFILKHPDLFQDGDVFSSCPECENGGSGDPRQTGDVVEYRRFIIAEYKMMQKSFGAIDKTVRANFFSMNGDVARLVMNKETTKALGGIVTIDHYVKTPEQLVQDVESIARESGGHVVLGEFGAPIPDIHGTFSEEQQKEWIARTLELLERSSSVEGVNYWLSVGGSTEIWSGSGREHQVVPVLRDYFEPKALYGFVRDELGRPIQGAEVHLAEKMVTTDAQGYYAIVYRNTEEQKVRVDAPGYQRSTYIVSTERQAQDVVLARSEKDWRFLLLELAQRVRILTSEGL